MKKLLLATAIVLGLATSASSRPQLHTQSIGWIDVSDITCDPTSDHTCVVKDSPCYEGHYRPDQKLRPCMPLMFTYADPTRDHKKYQVHLGTELIILNDRGNDLFYHPAEAKGRVEVAIVIPSDWDQRPEHESQLRPDKNCRLKTTSGAIDGSLSSDTPFVSLSCVNNSPKVEAAKADVEVQCQMGSSCIYQKVLSRKVVKDHDGTTVINARIRSCFKDFGPYNEKTGRYPVPSHYSCQLSDDINTDYVVAACNRRAPFVGGYDSKDGKWHLRQVVRPGTKHVVPDLVTYFMICHEYDGKGDLLSLAKRLGYNIPEQAEWQEHRPANINETGQEERVYDSLDELAKQVAPGTVGAGPGDTSIEKLECGGTEPFWNGVLTDQQITFELSGTTTRTYPKPTYAPAAGAPNVTSIQATEKTGQLTGFVVNETPPSYCSDGMSPRGFPFSVHLIVDGKPYTGCCASASHPIIELKE